MPVTINGTTGIAGVDGSAGTPSVQGTDTNTGMFFPAADTIAFSAGGTEDLRIGPAGQIGIQGANYGTSGQVFTSGGASAAPSWTTISVSPSGLLIRAPQILTSGTSYTTPSNCTKIYVEAVGGGGGGSTNAGNAGGGGGGYCAKYFTVTGSTAYTYAIGGAGTSSTSGGNTTFTVGGTTITANGGTVSTNTTAGGLGGVGSNGDLNVRGSDGGKGDGNGGAAGSGSGGSSVFGGGGRNSTAGGNYGGGGGANAAGAQGMIRIWEYT